MNPRLEGLVTAAVELLTMQRSRRFSLRRRADHETLLRSLQDVGAALQLTVAIDPSPPFDFLATFPRQPGLNFDIKIEMDGDELHLTVDGHLVLEVWTDRHPERLVEAIADIRELLTGESRVVVYYRDDAPVGAELEGYADGQWGVVGGWWQGNLKGIEWKHQLVAIALQNKRSP